MRDLNSTLSRWAPPEEWKTPPVTERNSRHCRCAAQTQQLILGDVDTLGNVDRENDGESEDVLRGLARNVAVDVAFDEAVGGDAFEHAAGFEVDDFGLEVDPCAVAVAEVDADVVDAGRPTGRGGSSGGGSGRGWSGGLGDDRGDDLVAGARALERDDGVSGGVVGAGEMS